MKKRTYLLALLAASMGVAAQAQAPGQVRRPSADARNGVAVDLGSVRKAKNVARFAGQSVSGNPLASARISKAMGDGTALNGTVVMADNWTEDDKRYGVYSFKAKENTAFEVLKQGTEFNSVMAVYAEGNYYVFDVQEMFGRLFGVSCQIYDAETWTIKSSVSNEAVWSNVPNASAMTYDYASGKVFGVTYNADASGYCWSEMDKTDGTFEPIAELSRKYITLAADAEGDIFAITDAGDLYGIEKETGEETLIGSTGLSPLYSQSTACDPQTGKLYWAFINDTQSALYEVNTETASPYKISDMPHFEEVVGMYILPSKQADGAPKQVSDLKFTPDVAGGMRGTLSCVAPTATAAGGTLSGNVTVTISTGDEQLLEQTVRPGARVEKTDFTFERLGLQTVYAVASNAAGESAKSSATFFVGEDVGKASSNVVLTVDGKKATLSWKAPTSGQSDGHVVPSELTYRIMRFADDRAGVTVQTTDKGVTTFSETLPGITASYSYAVTTLLGETEGGTSRSNAVLSVGHYELPFYDNFADGERTNRLYTFIDADNDGHDNQSEWFWKEDEKLMQYCSNKKNAANDWLITPAIYLDATRMYDLTFNVNMGAASSMKVTFGKSTDPKDHTEILDLNNINDSWKTPYKVTFAVPEAGDYYIGFYQYSDASSYWFNLFDIDLKEGISAAIPDSVANLSVVAGELGQRRADISFNAPEKMVNGKSISQPLSITISRGEAVVHTLTADAGEAVKWTDTAPEAGKTTYRVVAALDGETGRSSERTVWIGVDVPESVRDLQAHTVDGNMHVELSWKAPEKGANGAYFDINGVTYSVWRSLDGSNYGRLADNLTALTYTDKQIEEELQGIQDAYYYAVTADNESGQSEATARFIVVGTPYKLPQSESFANGRFNISPWTTTSVEGSFSFECMRDDDAGVSPVDGDRGFTKFRNSWGGVADSRLKTPVFDLSGSENPTFTIFMYHWLDTDVASDNGQTKLTVEISVDGGDFVQLGEPLLAGYEREGWIEHRFSLSDYKDAKHVQIGLRGRTDNNWMFFYIDNMHFEELEARDLAVLSFEGTEAAKVGETGTYVLNYFNRGVETADGYSVKLFQDGQLIGEKKGESIAPGEYKSLTFEVLLTAAKVEAGTDLYALIDYEGDGYVENNESRNVNTAVEGNWYPTVAQPEAVVSRKNVTVTWNAPELPSEALPTTDGAEDYLSFAIDGMGDWVTFDGDKRGCGSLNQLPDYPNKQVNQAFTIWAPSEIGLTKEEYPNLWPYSGEKCFMAWYANTTIDGGDVFNDDYLISPEVLGGSEVSFYLRRISELDASESYELMYSSTDNSPESFTVLSSGLAGYGWEKVSVKLPDDARYFAIHYTGRFQSGILVDDVVYTSALFALEVEGYNVFRNGLLLNASPITVTSYEDKDLLDGFYEYQVSVVYDRGESDASESVLADVRTGIEQAEQAAVVATEKGCVIVRAEQPSLVRIYAPDGRCVASGSAEGVRSFSVPGGIYVVRVGELTVKVAVD